MINFLFITCAVAVLASGSDIQVYRLLKIRDGVEIAQDIVHDKSENTVTITVGAADGIPGFVPTINFHDFDTKYVVFKDIRKGTCLLAHAPIPYPTPDIYKMGIINITLPYTAKRSGSILTNDDVFVTAGRKIAAFCEGYQTTWIDLKKDTSKRQVHADTESAEDAGVLTTPAPEQCLPVHIVARNFTVRVDCEDMKKDMKEPRNAHVLCVASWHFCAEKCHNLVRSNWKLQLFPLDGDEDDSSQSVHDNYVRTDVYSGSELGPVEGISHVTKALSEI